MPKIIGLTEQKQAMKDIIAGLKEVDSINRFLGADSHPNKIYNISLTTEAGEKITTTAYTDNKDDVDYLVLNQRERVISKIRKLSEDHRIEFDEKDLIILENKPAPIEEIPDIDDQELHDIDHTHELSLS